MGGSDFNPPTLPPGHCPTCFRRGEDFDVNTHKCGPWRTEKWTMKEEEALKKWMRDHSQYIEGDEDDAFPPSPDQSLQSSVPRAVFGRKWSAIINKLQHILIELRMERRSQRIEALEKFKRKYLC